MLPPVAARLLPAEAEATKLLTVDQMAELYACGRRSIYRWVESGHLPAPCYITPRRPRWRLSDVLAHLAELSAAK